MRLIQFVKSVQLPPSRNIGEKRWSCLYMSDDDDDDDVSDTFTEYSRTHKH